MSTSPARLTRRRVLQLGGISVVVGAGGACPAPVADPADAGRRPQDAGGQPGENPAYYLAPITPTEELYVQQRWDVPILDGAAWRLLIDGFGGPPIELGLADLRALPLVEQQLTLTCIGASPRNRAIGNARWRGLFFDDLLALQGLNAPPTGFLHLVGADGYETVVSVGDIHEHRVFLALAVGGAELPPEHGYPLRVLVLGRYGMKGPKWLVRAAAIEEHHIGTHEADGWSDDATVQPAAHVHLPRRNEELWNAPVTFLGSAFCGRVPIERVEVSDDDGASFREAEIVFAGGPDVWTLWRFPWTPPGLGDHELLVRVTAADGSATDPEAGLDLDGWNGFGYGIVRITVEGPSTQPASGT